MKQKELLTGFLCALILGASSTVFAQVKIGTDPTNIDPNNNLEVQASTTGRKTSVNKTTGQLTIADGTQGAGKILTSDANGNASWQSSSSFIFYASQDNTKEVPYNIVSGLTMGSLDQRIPYTPIFGTGYNSANKTFNIPATGYYRVTAGVRCSGTTSTRVEGEFVLQDGRYTPSDIVTNLSTTSSTFRSFSVVGHYPVSRQISFHVNNQSGTTVSCYTGYLAIERITPPAP